MSLSSKSLRILGAVTVVLVLSTAATASAATPAPPIVSPTFSYLDNQNQVSSSNCHATTTSTPPAPPPLVVNGPARTVADNVTGTVTSGTVSGDVTAVTVDSQATVRATASASYPIAITGNFTGTGTSTPAASHSPSTCASSGESETFLGAPVNLTRPGLVTFSASSNGAGIAEASVVSSSFIVGNSFESTGVMVTAPGATASGAMFLPAGSYEVVLEGGVALNRTYTSSTQSGSASVSVVFKQGGSRLSGPSGAARSFVAMGAARACSAHTLISHVAGARYASQIQTVTVLGNNKVLKRVTRPRAGSALTVALPDKQTEKVVVNVVLRTGRKLSETATYLRCS